MLCKEDLSQGPRLFQIIGRRGSVGLFEKPTSVLLLLSPLPHLPKTWSVGLGSDGAKQDGGGACLLGFSVPLDYPPLIYTYFLLSDKIG